MTSFFGLKHQTIRLIKRESVEQTIQRLVWRFMRDHHFTSPKGINDYFCYYFACDVQKVFPNARFVDTIVKPLNGCRVRGHTFVRIGNRYYDSEVPYGVNFVYQIPCLQRMGIRSKTQTVEYSDYYAPVGSWRRA